MKLSLSHHCLPQMEQNRTICPKEPLGKDLAYISRLYYGVITNKLKDIGIERYYYSLILIKEWNGTLTQKQLSEHICSDKVYTVKIVDYLSAKGLIKRIVNENDRREHFLTITPKGEKMVPAIAEAFNQTHEEIFKGVSKQDRETFGKVLGLVKQNLLSLPSDEVKINFKKVKNKGK